MKLKKVLACSIIGSVILFQGSLTFATTINKTNTTATGTAGVTGKLIGKHPLKKSGTISVGQALMSPMSTSGDSGSGDYGTDFLQAKAIGSHMMDADWKLTSSVGLITFVNVVTSFDNGKANSFKYGCLNTTEVNTGQTTFSNSGEHYTFLSGGGTVNWEYDFTIDDLADYANVY